MVIGKANEDYTYYKGFEDERMVSITTSEEVFPVYHIWEAYFTGIFEKPSLDGMGWCGFTRDCNEFKGVFDFDSFYYGEGEEYIITTPKEYLDDMLQYKGKKFFADEVYEVYDLVEKMLRHAVENGVNIVMTYF